MTGPSLYSEWKRKQAPPQPSLYDEWKRKQQPEAEAPKEEQSTLGKTWENIKGIASHPEELILSPLRDLKASFSPVQGTKYNSGGKFGQGGAPGGMFDRLPDGTVITPENTPNSITEAQAREAGINTAINAATTAWAPAKALGRRAIAAGVGAYYDKEDRLAGALTGLVTGEVLPLAGKATGALARRAGRMVQPLANLDLAGATSDVLPGIDSGMRNEIPKRRTAGKQTAYQGPRRAPETIDAASIADGLLEARTDRVLQAVEASTVRPSDPIGPLADKPFPEGYRTSATRPEPELEVVPQGADRGSKKILNKDVQAERIAGERLDVAEQRDAERRMVAEAKALETEKVAAEKAYAKAERDAEIAKGRLVDHVTKQEVQAEGKDAIKAFAAKQRTLKTMNLSEAAQRKADVARQAAEQLAYGEVPETASGMLGVANAQFSKQKRQAMAAQAVLARRRGVQPAPVVEPVVAPVEVPQPATQPLIAPAEPLGAPLRPSNPSDIPETGPPVSGVPVADAGGRGWTGGPGGVDAPQAMRPAAEPYLNYKTLGVDPSKPDALSTSTAARIDAMSKRPDIVERLKAERGSVSWSEGNQQAMESRVIQELGIDPLFADRDKMRKLSGHQIHALKPLLLENAGLMEGISREMQDLTGEDLAHATAKLDALEHSNAEILSTIQGESARAGRDLNALKQVAAVTTDPAYWLVKAQRVLGDKPMTAKIQANIIKLAKAAADACGGG